MVVHQRYLNRKLWKDIFLPKIFLFCVFWSCFDNFAHGVHVFFCRILKFLLSIDYFVSEMKQNLTVTIFNLLQRHLNTAMFFIANIFMTGNLLISWKLFLVIHRCKYTVSKLISLGFIIVQFFLLFIMCLFYVLLWLFFLIVTWRSVCLNFPPFLIFCVWHMVLK